MFSVEADPSEPRALRLVGELDMSTAASLTQALDALPAAGDLVLDLTGLTFLDSSGVRAFIGAARRLSGESARLVLRGAHGNVARVLELVRADSFPSVDLEPPP